MIAQGFKFDPDASVIVAMVQSLASKISRIVEPDMLIIDEAHHATAGTYRKIAAAWPNARVLGVTATPQRTDGKGLDETFDKMVFGPSPSALIADGYLSRMRYLALPQTVDLSGVASRSGDYALEQLASAMDQRRITGDAEAHYRKHLAGRPAIAFCATVAHAEHVAEQFAEAGWNAASVDGSMAPDERARRIAAIGNGGLNVLTSCEIVSEGTDIPSVAGAILLRPTQSLIVYLQQVGRVLRPKPDGSVAVILDHVGNVFRHGMPDSEREWSLAGIPKKDKPPAVRQCGECYAVFPPAAVCPECGAVLTNRASKTSVGQILEATDDVLVEFDGTKESLIAATAPLLRQAWQTGNGVEAQAIFRQVGKLRGYKPGWAFIQTTAWKQRRNQQIDQKVAA
jgi:superfamily II DNA or RNA helicase